MPQTGDTDILTPLDEPTDYLRAQITRDNHGRIVAFFVQYETRIGDDYLPVTRYDTAHGVPHQDVLDRNGNVIAKHWLYHLGVAAALDYANDDLRRFWTVYKQSF
jgi:hypothetical protein